MSRPDLSRKIEITDEMRETYNSAKDLVVKKRKALALVAVGIALVFYVRINGPLEFVILGVAACLFVAAFFKFRSVKTNTGRNLSQLYIEGCIEPLVKQAVPDATVRDTFTYFPLYGGIEAFEDHAEEQIEKIGNSVLRGLARGVANLADRQSGIDGTTSNKDLGKWLEDKCVIPTFSSHLENGFVIDSLESNGDGFMFANAKATTVTHDSDGHSHTTIEFMGPLVAMKMKHAARSGVSLYTSKTGKFLFKKFEHSNGYKRVDVIDTENDEFNENFEVTAEEQSQAFFVLSPLVAGCRPVYLFRTRLHSVH